MFPTGVAGSRQVTITSGGVERSFQLDVPESALGGEPVPLLLVYHGVLSNGASANIDKSLLKELVVTDTINHSDQVAKSKKIRTLSLAPLIGEAIRRIANDESISKMFD